MRIKECKEWDKLPIEIREILLENQKLINQHLLELEDDKSVCSDDLGNHGNTDERNTHNTTESQFSISKEKAGVKKDANIE